MAEREGTTPEVESFITRWLGSGAAERSNYQLFLSGLCRLLGVPEPEPATANDSRNAYVFERAVTFTDGDGRTTTNFIDLYKRGCLLLEAKQGSEPAPAADEPVLSEEMRALRASLKRGTAKRGTQAWDTAMLRARGQGDQYIRALPASEGRPPFLVVVDVGHSIELYSEFTCTGGTYTPFPAAGSHRIFLQDLEDAGVRERLRLVWTDPQALDPSRRSARVTRQIAAKLAQLAIALEQAGHDPQAVAAFLMRCLFTMFAEDVWLLPKDSFKNLLGKLRDTPEHFVPMAAELWQKMNTGGFSTSLGLPVLWFNGGLFADATALPLTRDQLLLLTEAAGSDWREVEPAIFGTLLERALDPVERHKLGGHFTPRAYVERLVQRTVMAPLRAEWEAVQAAAVTLANGGDLAKAAAEVRHCHRRLCELRILDPACGTANFLYVTFDLLKRLEQEVFDTLDRLGDTQRPLEMAGQTVFPNQFLGLEVNPRAAAIAELVLWIGCLQWHHRTHGNVRPPEPIIRNFRNVECRDAVLTWDATEPVLDAAGQPVTHWDGRTMKLHPTTGQAVPDETARVPVLRTLNPRPAVWPAADYVVGNPPFIGDKEMRETLGSQYVEALRAAHPDVPGSADFVMFWWNQAAALVGAGQVQRFGLVTTNSLSQTFNRRVVEAHLAGESRSGVPSCCPAGLAGPSGIPPPVKLDLGRAGSSACAVTSA